MATYTSAPVTPETLAGFIAGITASVAAYYAKTSPKLTPPQFEMMEGPKFIRVVRTGQAERSCFCFIEKSSGFILKPAGWKAPAKHARGSINTPTFGAEYVGPYGPAYLK